MSAASEQVLCVKREDIFPDGAWHGFVSDGLERHQKVIREHHFFMPRADVENDPNYQQIIPYVVFRHGDRYFLHIACAPHPKGGCASSTRWVLAATSTPATSRAEIRSRMDSSGSGRRK